MVFPVVIYGCENWTIKKTECWRIGAFELWCWRKILRVPWSARRSNQSILNDISPEYSLEGLMLNLKLQYFGHLMWTADSLEKTLMLGNTEDKREEGNRGWMDRQYNWLNEHELEKTPIDREQQRSLGYWNPGHKELDTTWWMNSNNNNITRLKTGK